MLKRQFSFLKVYEVCPEGIQPHNMKNRHIYWRYKIQETLYKGQLHFSPLQRTYLGTSQFSQSPLAAPSYFPESHQWSEISFFSKVILVLGKAKSHRASNLGYRGAESPGWFDVSPKNSAWDVMHEWACCCDEAANHQLSIAAAFWIIQIASMAECSSLTQNLMQIRCSTCSFILSVMLTQQHLLPPLSNTEKSSLFAHEHSSPLALAARLC